MHQEQRKSWFEKNWWWSIPCGCLGCLTLVVGGCALVLGGTFMAVKSGFPFEEALSRAQAHPVVVERLGEPIESGLGFSGRVDTRNGETVADVTFPIKGPRGEGTVRAKGDRVDGVWEFEILEVELDDGTVVDLLGPEERGHDPDSEV